MLTKKNILITLLLTVILATPAFALKVGQLFFDEWYTRDSLKMALSGAGLKKFLNIQVIAVGLYLPEGLSSKDALEDHPKRLEVVYLQNIPNREIHRITIKGILANVTKQEFENLKSRVDKINSYIPDVKKGDKVAVTYLPQKGLEVTVNDKIQGVVPGEDLARAFYSIWIGKKPVDPQIKNLLLGLAPTKAVNKKYEKSHF